MILLITTIFIFVLFISAQVQLIILLVCDNKLTRSHTTKSAPHARTSLHAQDNNSHVRTNAHTATSPRSLPLAHGTRGNSSHVYCLQFTSKVFSVEWVYVRGLCDVSRIWLRISLLDDVCTCVYLYIYLYFRFRKRFCLSAISKAWTLAAKNRNGKMIRINNISERASHKNRMPPVR